MNNIIKSVSFKLRFFSYWRLLAVVFAFLFNSCEEEERKIDESQIPDIKTGGVVTVSGQNEDGSIFTITEKCQLLGLRKVNGLSSQYKANFNAYGTGTDLDLDFEFKVFRAITTDSAICQIDNSVKGSLKVNGKIFDLSASAFPISTSGYSLTASNIQRIGQKCNLKFSLNYIEASGQRSFPLNFSIETTLLP